MSMLLMIAYVLLNYQAAQNGPDEHWTFRGDVVDPNGEPVADAVVQLFCVTRPLDETRTDAQGHFDVEAGDVYSIAPRTAWVLFRSPDESLQAIVEVPRAANRTSNPTRIVLTPAHELLVRVVDRDGEPISGAHVIARQEIMPLVESKSDADGLARLKIPRETKLHDVIAYKDGAGFDYYENYRRADLDTDEFDPLPGILMLTLDGAREVRLAVRDRSGRSVEGVRIGPSILRKSWKLFPLLLSAGDSLQEHSDRDGVVRFGWLPQDLQGNVPFTVLDPRYHAENWTTYDPASAVTSTPLIVKVVENGVVTGRVSKADGSPAPGITIATNAIRNQPALTDASGMYELRIPPRIQQSVIVIDDQLAAPIRRVVVEPGQSVGGINFVVGPGTLVHGRVESGTNDESRVPSILFLESGEEEPTRRFSVLRSIRTDEHGNYSFRVGDGRYSLWLIGAGEDADGTKNRALEIAGQESIEENFTSKVAPPRYRVVRGSIRDTDGSPATGVMVWTVTADRWSSPLARPNSQGRFTLKVGEGGFLIYARDRPGGRVATAWLAPDADVGQEIELKLEPTASVLGRVVDRWGDTPAGIKIDVVAEISIDSGDVKPPPLKWTNQTAEGGWYHVGGIPNGSRVTIRCSGSEVVVERAMGEQMRAEVLMLKEQPEPTSTPLPEGESRR